MQKIPSRDTDWKCCHCGKVAEYRQDCLNYCVIHWNMGEPVLPPKIKHHVNYLQVVYGSYKPSTFDGKLAKYVTRFFPKDKSFVLDVGYGNGRYMQEFQMLGHMSAGLDKNDCNFEKNLSVASNSVDVVFCKSVIEHIKDTDKFLSEIHRVLKPGGVAIILTPAWEHNFRWFYDDYTHVKPFHRKGLQDALRINNFTTRVDYMYYLPFLWQCKLLSFIPWVLKHLPDKFRWKDKDETIANVLVRFSKEIQLMAIARKAYDYKEV